MGEDLLYSRFPPGGKSYYIASFPGGKATMGEKLLYNTGEGLQNFGLCSTLRAFEQGGIFIVPHPL
jgi:hypothetical protein